MSNESARHQLVWAIVQRHPGSVVALAEAAGVPLPEHDQVTAAPGSHPVRDGDPVYTDATVQLRKGVLVFFATVEMQRKYEKGKYATLHAYHGSGVRGTDAGGHLFLLSDRASTAARFRAEDAGRRAELAFAASFYSGRDLEPLADAGLPLGARALPAAHPGNAGRAGAQRPDAGGPVSEGYRRGDSHGHAGRHLGLFREFCGH